jgi:hypothetical protein
MVYFELPAQKSGRNFYEGPFCACKFSFPALRNQDRFMEKFKHGNKQDSFIAYLVYGHSLHSHFNHIVN